MDNLNDNQCDFVAHLAILIAPLIIVEQVEQQELENAKQASNKQLTGLSRYSLSGTVENFVCP